ncbi:MAG: threonine--tRNA ligase, partial [Clostridia bacterium]|nr:threonine--tRNA ligase [Clostridia bacterium]
RTFALLIEKYNGAFPLWLSAEQVRVLSLTDRTIDNALEVKKALVNAGIRAEADVRSEKLGKKIREAQLEKVNYILIIGDKEAEQGLVAVRHRSEGDLGTMTLDEFKSKVLLETAEKRLDK